jgi:murein DD-endopeptidase MepM/ murein hydrolase activator NlpD
MLLLFKAFNKHLSKTAHIVMVAALLFTFTMSDVSNMSLFKANSFGNIKHAPFDGLVYPYMFGADWVALNESERTMAYAGIPSSKKIDPLRYSASELAIPVDSLGFSRAEDVRIRNAKITYSVPYLGNYKLDGIEGGGSHAAVDIKLPMQTPVLAMGNGVVVKAEDQPGGFGLHVVVRHNNFPDVNDPTRTTTYFSSYSHMDSYTVQPGDIVKKGQVIGLSGESGTASTPHLHFQIDKETAPWHPYWPFTGSEASEAGLNFFEAVNAGLGRENGKLNTINPMQYVQAHLGTISNQIAEVVSDQVTYVDSNSEIIFDNSVNLQSELSIEAPETMIIGKPSIVRLKYTSNGNSFASLATDQVEFRPSLVSSYNLPAFLDFSNGEVEVSVTPKELGEMNIRFASGSVTAESSNISVKLFSDLSNNDADIRSIKILKDKGIIKGFEDGTYKPDDTLNKAQAAKLVVESLPASVKSNLDLVDINFSDVNKSDWYYEYVQVLASLGAVDRDRMSFEPMKSVNLAEYLKLLYTSLGADLSPEVDSIYSSYFDIEQWYASFVQEGLKSEIIDTGMASRVSDGLKRREVARITAAFLSNM